MSTIIKNSIIYGENGNILRGRYLIVEGQYIKKISDDLIYLDEYLKKNSGAEIIDAKGMLLLPGFYNTHTHTPMSILRNFGNDLPLDKWLFEKVIPKEQLLGKEERYWGSLLSQAEMIKSGCTGYIDMYDPADVMFEAAKESGMRAVITVAPLTNTWEGGRHTHFKHEEAEQYIRDLNNGCDGRIKIYVEIHSIYLYDPSYLKKSVELARKYNVGIHMHLHETVKEVRDSVAETGLRPFEYFEKIGAFECDTVAAHCVYLSQSEIERAASYGINVSLNTSSNLKLGSGIAPAADMLKAGVHLSLGTDGCSSNNNVNIIEEMHLTSLLHKGINKNPEMFPSDVIIDMASNQGARAMGIEGKAGTIKEGMLADILLADTGSLHLTPVNDYGASVVYSLQGSDVNMTMVNGRILMKDRQFTKLDEEKIKWNVNRIADKILEKR